MAKYYNVLIKVEDSENIVAEEDGIEAAIEETLEFLPYDLHGRVLDIRETDEDQ